MTTDLAIAQRATLRPIADVAATLGLGSDDIIPYGHHKAKLAPHVTGERDGKLILVTAISPTPAGEGKTTTTIGLADALRTVGADAMACLREPSLGPCFGVKGGATGGGYAQVLPMEDINLHFTGDFHAITSAHNLLSAMIDNHLHWGNAVGLDVGRIAWRRVLDMNDRALRDIVVGLGGRKNGVTREAGFDITVASEVMAILCLATGVEDLKARLSRIVVGERADGTLVRAADIDASGAMTALLAEAIRPNIVQTLEGTPVFIHGGPFANIAHGCNSVIATNAALRLADYVVTEAGFGADLGAEKFFNIKCRKAGLVPSAAVVVATVRALKMHGGVPRGELGSENVAAVRAGAANLLRHVENVQRFGVPVTVAINRFTADTEAELAAVAEAVSGLGVKAILCEHWAKGGEGAADLAREVLRLTESEGQFHFTYPDALPLWDKIEAVAKSIYRAGEVAAAPGVRAKLDAWEAAGFGELPVCMAKTQSSFSADPTRLGAPENFTLPIRDVRLSAGAGFVVALTGELMTMPGLPRHPAAERIDVVDGRIEGLF
ncbi:formate--tetrahydrofolate ligase [Acuticoccus mangrovi]|uniref:Formate--tetrahydrofolate ligase n=1 Tax=Acuticoccus mangrovi TaxID=2796142 RepID=A0A934IKY7_9HYPH|nr:formate--tetrahydrofolate ligase [Acuticoccus mangrovi]MBJ3775712.1 formate--tetrahydrofolate ligase [Acuticoccus mangrovi]